MDIKYQVLESPSITFDEKLANCVKQYPCLYDNTRTDYRDKTVGATAWDAIAEEMKLDEGGEQPRRCFENLKKRFSKKRMDLKRAELSGTPESVAEAKTALEKLNYLTWLLPYIRARTSKSDYFTQDLVTESEALININTHHSDTGSTNGDVDDTDQQHTYENSKNSFMLKRKPPFSNAYGYPNKRKSSDLKNNHFIFSSSDMKNNQIQKCNFFENDTESNLISGNLKLNPVVNNTKNNQIVNNTKTNTRSSDCQQWNQSDDANELFGRTIAAELKTFSKRDQILAKHQIRNVLFTLQMNSLSNESVSYE